MSPQETQSRRPPRRPLSTRELDTILDFLSDGVFTVDREFLITSFNRAAERLTGFSVDEAIGHRCDMVLRSTNCQSGCLLRETMETGEPVIAQEVTIRNRHGQERTVCMSACVLRNDGGDIVGGIETFRDLTALEGLRREIRGRHTLADIISKNHRMQRVFALIPDVALSNAAVLIQGETGTGKELLARAIHNASPRCAGPFIEVNCGALPDTLLESELFGHVTGAFTDARTDRTGRFEMADGGTLFLDEIGDTSAAMQVKLLRVLQDGTFVPVGSSETRHSNARVIAATNQDLKSLVGEGRFREDLYYRVNTVCIHVPPLRERREDIPLLVEHFMDRFNVQTGKMVRRVSGDAMQALLAYAWPGNVRELEHAVEHVFVLVKGDSVRIEHLPEEVIQGAVVRRGLGGPPSARSILEESERRAIQMVLERLAWNKVAASRELGVSRTTLWRKMRKLGISN